MGSEQSPTAGAETAAGAPVGAGAPGNSGKFGGAHAMAAGSNKLKG